MPPGSPALLDSPDISFIYARFTALTALSTDLGGWLLLYSMLDRDGVAVAMASNVAGAASLGIEPDAERAKLALRAGVCDFLVNNLDEALRILKNEIRKHRAVSVVLTGEVDAEVAEIVARGVQPEILAFPAPQLMERGARLLPVAMKDGRTAVTWSVKEEPVRWLSALDTLAAAALPASDARVRWLEAAPRYLGRAFAGQRFLRMTDAEADGLIAAIRAAVRTGVIPVAVLLTRNGAAISIAP
ncbi:MAG: hypothetical protein WA634_05745 [Silvibacterium sp.]